MTDNTIERVKELQTNAVWSIGIYRGPDPFNLGPAPGAANPVMTRVHVTDIAADFVADPFLFRAQDRWHLFFEAMNSKTGRGDIGLAVSDDELRWEYRQIVLTEPFHLSYPYVFEWQDDIYMIPETYQAGAVRLYRADPFPTQWTFVRELIRAPYIVDASIFRHDDKWFLFADTSLNAAHDTLRLFYSEELTGPWIEHPKSPLIVGHPYVARPAGRVIHINDNPVRFTQGCKPHYGTNVRAFEIVELTLTTYREQEARPTPILGPTGAGWNAHGMHHVDAHLVNGSWIASVDGWYNPKLQANGNPPNLSKGG